MKQSSVFDTDFQLNIDVNNLHDSLRFLQTLLCNLPGYVYRCHKQDNIWCTQFASSGIYELTGYQPEDFVGGKLLYGDLVHVDDQEYVRKLTMEALTNQQPYQFNYRIHIADGTTKRVWEQGRGIYENDELVATEGFITDITEKIVIDDNVNITVCFVIIKNSICVTVNFFK